MEIFDAQHSNSKIKALIGDPVGLELKGSTTYFINRIFYKSNPKIGFIGYKGIFEKYSEGLLLWLYKSDKRHILPISYDKIKKIKLAEGKEEYEAAFLSPMWIMLKLGVSIKTARYFQVRGDSYEIDNSTLEIITDNYKINLISNGFSFKSQYEFFSSLNLGNKLIIKKASA